MSSKTTTNSEAPRQAWWGTLNSICGAMLLIAIALLSIAAVPATAQAQQQRPNILFIMGDDIGWFNIGAYHHGIMSGKTPNLDRLASKACASPTTMPRRVAPRAAPISSPASYRSAPE
jgi:hypothetical protein